MASIDFNTFDRTDQPQLFVLRASGAVVVGLLLGGAVDAAARRLQGTDASKAFSERNRARAGIVFGAQAFLDILLLLAILRVYPRFTEFFQLSICGALFGIVLFSVQRNLAENALCLTNV
jgi:hypothetical protein